LQEEHQKKIAEENSGKEQTPKEPPKYSNSDLDPYITHSWLFKGLNKK
jgi:hypothetical protein